MSEARLGRALERIRRRLTGLEPLEGHFSSWEGEETTEEENSLGPKGKLHLMEAVIEARRALVSGHPNEIKQACELCEDLERQAAATARRFGGKKRGKSQAADAAETWKSLTDKYNAYITRGMTHLMARAMIQREIVRTGFVLPNTKKPPSGKTLRERLPNPRKKKVEPS